MIDKCQALLSLEINVPKEHGHDLAVKYISTSPSMEELHLHWQPTDPSAVANLMDAMVPVLKKKSWDDEGDS